MSVVYFGEFDKLEDKLSADQRIVWENSYKSCPISRGEIDKVAVKLCNFNGRQAGSCEKKFYESLVGMILACSNSRYVANEGYTEAEPSIKSSLSYFAGMVAARVVGENKNLMGLDPLLHAKDSFIKLGRVNAFTPDFVGFNKGPTSAYLLEAKGKSWSKDSAGKIKRVSLEHAKDQLSSIGHFYYDNKLYSGPSISRYVITSEFCKSSSGASSDKEWRISKIDPPSKGTAILFSDPHISLTAHYENIVRLFELCERADVATDARVGGDVVAVHFGSSVIGLDRGIYEKMGAFYCDFYGANKNEKYIKSDSGPWIALLRESFDGAAQAINKELFDEIGRLKGTGPYGKSASGKKFTDDEKAERQIEIDKLCLELVRDSKFYDAFQSTLEDACPEMFEPKSPHSLLEWFESDGDGVIICEG